MKEKEVKFEEMESVDLEALKSKEPKKKKRQDPIASEAVDGLDKLVERTKKESFEFQEKRHEDMIKNGDEEDDEEEKINPKSLSPYDGDVDVSKIDATLDKLNKSKEEDEEEKKFSLEDDKLIEEAAESIKDSKKVKEESKVTDKKSIFDIEDEDIEDEEDSNEKEQMSELKESVKEKIKPVLNVVNLSSFTVAKKPVSIVNALNVANANRTSDWILPATDVSVSMTDFKADDLEKLNTRKRTANRFEMFKTAFKIMYDHINFNISPKPTFEQWLRTVNFYDLDHLYFAIFKASFNDSNLIPYQCPHCKHVWLQDKNIEELVKYSTDKVKKDAEKLLQKVEFEPAEYKVERVQITDTIVMDLKEPSIYDIIFESAKLDDDFTSKYSDVMSFISYIDGIYVIDRENSQLLPINLTNYPDKPVKTLKEKIRIYSNLLKSLNSDQYYFLQSYMTAIQKNHDSITYVLPSSECPKCHKEIPEAENTAESLLFTRHRLGAMRSM